MCGIVGYIGTKQAEHWLLDGLQALEYRGYDSAGLEVVGPSGRLSGVKCAGRVADLRKLVEASGLSGTCGIGHTRWATHGAPTDANAHPHLDDTGRFAVVHNGIIENHQQLQQELASRGHVFASDTDTEVIPHLIREAWDGPAHGDLARAVREACERLEGSWGIAVVCADAPGELVVARNRSPLVVAATEDGAYVASDAMPLANVASDVIQLDDGDVATLRADGTIVITDSAGRVVHSPKTLHIDWDASAATLGGHADFMEKEIEEQPEAIGRLLANRLGEHGVELDELALTNEELASIDRIFLIGCGTSYHVGLIAKAAIERWARIPVCVEYASEFNYSHVLVTDHTMCVIITQSGETADTLAAARRMRGMGCGVFAITNVLGSTAAREADGVLYIQAGPEVAVASTKAYTAQMVASYLLALRLGLANGTLSIDEVRRIFAELEQIPALMGEVLARGEQDERAAWVFQGTQSALYLGRNVHATTALEGALKLKEISYLHAEAYPAGEMKHGPIALIEEGFPVVAIVPRDHVHDKTVSNIEESIARGAVVVGVATDGDEVVAHLCREVLWVPPCPNEFVFSAVAALHVQVLARHVARGRGCDVDKPRNLAKSVTVE